MHVRKSLKPANPNRTVGWEDINVKALAYLCGKDTKRTGAILTGRAGFRRLIDLVRIAEELRVSLDTLYRRIENARALDQQRVELKARRMLAGPRNRYGEWRQHPRLKSDPNNISVASGSSEPKP